MYCTIDDIIRDMSETTLIEVSNDSASPGAVNNDLVNAKIAEVSTYIDSYLSNRYPVPITESSDLPILNRACVSLVVCDLFQRRYSFNYPEGLISRRKTAIADLINLRDGAVFLKTGTATTIVRKQYVTSEKESFFSEQAMRKFLS